MGVTGSEKFVLTGIKVFVKTHDFPVPGETFPYEGRLMTCLGKSNKVDLVPSFSDWGILRPVGDHGREPEQFIYTDQQAIIYDVCIYLNGNYSAIMYAIRTRQAPDKPKKKRIKTDEDIQGST